MQMALATNEGIGQRVPGAALRGTLARLHLGSVHFACDSIEHFRPSSPAVWHGGGISVLTKKFYERVLSAHTAKGELKPHTDTATRFCYGIAPSSRYSTWAARDQAHGFLMSLPPAGEVEGLPSKLMFGGA